MKRLIYFLLLISLCSCFYSKTKSYSASSLHAGYDSFILLYSDTFHFYYKTNDTKYTDRGNFKKINDQIYFQSFKNKTDTIFDNHLSFKVHHSTAPNFDTCFYFITNLTDNLVSRLQVGYDSITYQSLRPINPKTTITTTIDKRQLNNYIYFKYNDEKYRLKVYEINAIELRIDTLSISGPLFKSGKVSKHEVSIDSVSFRNNKPFRLYK